MVIDHDIDEQTATISLLTCSTRSQLRAASQSLVASILAILRPISTGVRWEASSHLVLQLLPSLKTPKALHPVLCTRYYDRFNLWKLWDHYWYIVLRLGNLELLVSTW